MKIILQVSFIVIILFALSSCCTKKDCSGFDDIREIQMINFIEPDVDSIAVEIFVNGSNHTERLDSSFTNAHGRGMDDFSLIIFLNDNISRSCEYKVTLLSVGTGQTYFINNFITRKESCNECLPFRTPTDYNDVLDSYDVNGQKVNNSVLTITK